MNAPDLKVRPLKDHGPNRSVLTAANDAPATVDLLLRPSASAHGRVKAMLAVVDEATVVVIAEFRLEMN